MQGNNGKDAKLTKLNPRQLLFVKHYLDTFNATKALVQAGYKTKYPAKISSRMLKHPSIKATVDKCRLKLQKETDVTFEWKMDKLRQIVEKEELASKNRMKAIEIMNVMQGHNAATKHVNINANYVSTELDEARTKYLSINNAQPILIESKPSDDIDSDNIDSKNQSDDSITE